MPAWEYPKVPAEVDFQSLLVPTVDSTRALAVVHQMQVRRLDMEGGQRNDYDCCGGKGKLPEKAQTHNSPKGYRSIYTDIFPCRFLKNVMHAYGFLLFQNTTGRRNGARITRGRQNGGVDKKDCGVHRRSISVLPY